MGGEHRYAILANGKPWTSSEGSAPPRGSPRPRWIAKTADRRPHALFHQWRGGPCAKHRGVLLGGRRADPQRMGTHRDIIRGLLQHSPRAPISDRWQTTSRRRAE